MPGRRTAFKTTKKPGASTDAPGFCLLAARFDVPALGAQ
jgi:hypothetical protein